jgi:hypothetical protein
VRLELSQKCHKIGFVETGDNIILNLPFEVQMFLQQEVITDFYLNILKRKK